MANDQISQSISDIGFYEFRRQLEYKTALAGGVVAVVDRWFPSSKTVSSCGAYCESMPLSMREWTCAQRGAEYDRDIKTALNLQREVLATHSWAGSYAFGEEGAGRRRKTPVKLASVKPEINRGIKDHG